MGAGGLGPSLLNWFFLGLALVSAPLPCICTPTTCTCTPALLEAAVSIPTVFEVVVIAVRLLLLPGGVRLALGPRTLLISLRHSARTRSAGISAASC